jgi:hypothetical protein
MINLDKYHIKFSLTSQEKKELIINQIITSATNNFVRDIKPTHHMNGEAYIPHSILLEHGKRMMHDAFS